jgi:hypothetical protein
MNFTFREEDSHLHFYNAGELLLSLSGKDKGSKFTGYLISNYLSSDVIKKVTEQCLKVPISSYPLNLDMMLYGYNDFLCGFIYIKPSKNGILISFQFENDVDEWRYPFTVKEFNDAVCARLKSMYVEIDDEEYFRINIKLKVSNEDANSNLAQLIDRHSSKIKKIVEEEKIKLTNKNIEAVFVKVFNFPSEYKNICSQYLMWFGEFLRNLGIKANVSTQQNIKQTVLIVSPERNGELLTQVEQLFYQYIQLPYMETLSPQQALSPQELHAYQSAVMQVQHLQTQVQMKDAVIASYKATNIELMKQAESHHSQKILLDSLEEDKKYEFFGGALKIPIKQTIGKNGKVEIDLSKIFRNKR